MLGGNLGSILYGDVSVMVDVDTPVRFAVTSHLLMAKLSRLAAKMQICQMFSDTIEYIKLDAE